jgi:hypothetical protein
MSAPTRQRPGAAQRGDGDAARAAKARRNAWLLAGVAAFIYVAYMITLVVRGG